MMFAVVFLLIGSASGATLDIISLKAPIPVLVARADNVAREVTTIIPAGLSVVPMDTATTRTTTELVETTILSATTKLTDPHHVPTVAPRANAKGKKLSRVSFTTKTPEGIEHPYNTVPTRSSVTTKKNGGRLSRYEKVEVKKTVVIGEGVDDIDTLSRSRREAATVLVQVVQHNTTESPIVNATRAVAVVIAKVIPVEVVNVALGSGEVVKKELNRPARQLGMGSMGGVGAGMGPVGGMSGLGGGLGGGFGGDGMGGMGMGGLNAGLGSLGGMGSFGTGMGGIGGGMGMGGIGGPVVEDTMTHEEVITP